MENLSMIGVSIGIVRSKMLVFRKHQFRLLIGSVVTILTLACSAEAKTWRGITPLHTTRAVVEQQLGQPTMDNGDTVVYEFDNERASIEYSKERCTTKAGTWKVPPNTVLSIWVTPKSNDWTLRTFGVEPSRLRQKRDEHVLNVIHYIDDKDGAEYNVDENTGSVALVKYLPSAADKKLRCPRRKNR